MQVNPIGSMRESDQNLLAGGRSYVAEAVGDGLGFTAAPMRASDWLTFDILVGGRFAAVFELVLAAGADVFKMPFSVLNQCSARIRLPLTATSQNAWALQREGAWLKPMCWGAAVDPAKVDRVELRLSRHDGRPVHFAITPIRVTADAPAKLQEPILPAGPLLDEFGQSRLHEWPTKTKDQAELVKRLKEQDAAAAGKVWPASFSKWGGMANGPKQKASGYFRTHHDGRRWWLVDPDGHLFWSAGMDCVRSSIDSAYAGIEPALSWLPPTAKDGRANFLGANFDRAFGEPWHDAWSRIALSHLRQFGFNTVANWSEWDIARAAGFPYVRPLEFRPKTPRVFRDFPDVFHQSFASDCSLFAGQLLETRDDPALIGYFLMNEPTWGFASQSPAEGMLINTESCDTRTALATFLRDRHGESLPWGSYEQVERGRWQNGVPADAKTDLEAFSTVMVEKLMRGLSEACKQVDPNHLNLGARYYTVPPAWALRGMDCFDVFSINCYDDRVRPERLAEIAKVVDRPVLVGEWHFGALDVGLPASGIGRVAGQAERGQAFRYYTETAAALPQCVGVHYFTHYDQSALGRFDGEHYNIGFVDVCNRIYEPLAKAARESHERLYDVAAGKTEPFNTPPQFLPKLFM